MELRRIPLSEIPNLETPTQKIHSDQDVQVWRTTQSYHDFSIFLRRLTESVVGYTLPWSSASPSTSILDRRNTTARNTSEIWKSFFSEMGARLEERVDQLLTDLVSHEFTSLIPHVKPYLLTSFGSFLRMDYGTGHETSFALFLLCLTLVRFFQPQPDEERELVFRVFTRYLQLCWKLQDVYRLEPAGSHGVWGLDDSHFLGYIFGSGQLRDQTEIPVSAVLHPPLPPTNLYFMSIMRIHQVKHGPFHEHSSQLHSIAVGVPNWGKVNSGLFKMYEAEVLGKRVVVQHIPLSGLLEWSHNGAGQTDTPQQGTSSANASATSNPSSLQAPWATTVHSQPHSQTTMPARSSWSTQTHLPRSRATPGNQQSEDFM